MEGLCLWTRVPLYQCMYELVLMFGRRENMYIPCNVFGISNVDNHRMVPYCTSFLYAKHVSSYAWFHSVGVQKLLLPRHVLLYSLSLMSRQTRSLPLPDCFPSALCTMLVSLVCNMPSSYCSFENLPH